MGKFYAVQWAYHVLIRSRADQSRNLAIAHLMREETESIWRKPKPAKDKAYKKLK